MAKGDKHIGETDQQGNKEAAKEMPAVGQKLTNMKKKLVLMVIVNVLI